MDDQNLFIGVPQIAKAVFGSDDRSHQNAIRRMCHRGEMPHTRIDCKTCVTASALKSWLAGRTAQCLRSLRPELLKDFKNFELPKAKKGRPPKAAALKLVANGGD